MKRYAFYFGVGLLSFSIGYFVAFNFCWKLNERFSTLETINSEEYISEEINVYLLQEELEKNLDNIENRCLDEKLNKFWATLDKKAFLELKKKQLKSDNKSYPAIFQEEWKALNENFDCSYFNGIQLQIDVNNDGEEELFVRGKITSNHADSEMFVFQKRSDKYQIILFDSGTIEVETTGRKNKRYSEIVVKSNYCAGSRSIIKYQFTGQMYKPQKCFTEDLSLWKRGNLIQLDKPLIRNFNCNG